MTGWAERRGLDLCMTAIVAGLSGCFYVRDIPATMPNLPPDIIEPPQPEQTVRVRGDRFTLIVVASDPEGDPLTFEFPDLLDVAHSPPERFQNGELWVVRTEVLDPDAVIGSTLRALVFDGDRDNTVTVRWQVEAP